ncbi:MAG: hypothetical protein GX791_01410 [Synergistaceae bacterium]|nr:hypothetical protein [Synergistaceae bacterium]
MLRIGLSLTLLALTGYGVVLYTRRRTPGRTSGNLKILASLPLGRDVLFLVRCGPDVLAITTGSAGARVIGRWRYEEWIRSTDEEPGQQ